MKKRTNMPISNGDQMPEGSLRMMTESVVKDKSTADLFNGRKVVLFPVHGSFTSNCSNKHLPSYLAMTPSKPKGLTPSRKWISRMLSRWMFSVMTRGLRTRLSCSPTLMAKTPINSTLSWMSPKPAL